jgi:NADH-quinone oxidoreductase subunit H
MDNLFIKLGESIQNGLSGMFSPGITDILMSVIHIVAILVFILLNVLWLVLLERKLGGYFQQRPGPNRTGPWGLLQTLADVTKLIAKEDIIPKNADKWVFRAAGVCVFIPALMVYAIVPFDKGMSAVDLNLGIFYFLAIASTSTVAFLMAGWSSNNKYSLIGGMRSVAQMVSYEIPLVFSLIGIVMLTGSLQMSDIIAHQEANSWNIFVQPLAFLIYFVAATAELNRGPFDLPEGEQELVAGIYTEISGARFAVFFLAEYTNLLAVSAIAATLFLGGWLAPFGWTFLPGYVWFILKIYLMVFLFMWVRWTYPRVRIDHLMALGWKFLIPVSLANIVITGVGIKVFDLYFK